jgi:hypothetical protein
MEDHIFLRYPKRIEKRVMRDLQDRDVNVDDLFF